MRIAIVGAGVAGLGCAYHLMRQAASSGLVLDVTVFESNNYLGGHANTIDIDLEGLSYPIDTGFLVYNQRTYPKLIELFDHLQVPTVASEMSFSVKLDQIGLEWCGSSLDSVFTQRRNLYRPAFLGMLRDILRFNAKARTLVRQAQTGSSHSLSDLSVGEFLVKQGYSQAFRDWYFLPMIGSIWSCPVATMMDFPIDTLVRFCYNHGLLQIFNRPTWFTVKGGSREYIRKLSNHLVALSGKHQNLKILMQEPVKTLSRQGQTQSLTTASNHYEFDQVVFASHSDQTLRILSDPSSAEQSILGAIRYQDNRAVVHTDSSLLPARRKAWAAWNYSSRSTADQASIAVHYLINKLQPIPFETPVIVSLNPTIEPQAGLILREVSYSHPVFDRAAIRAQQHLSELQGKRNTWFCGAWTGYGFHEDGLSSGLRVADQIFQSLSQAKSARVVLAS